MMEGGEERGPKMGRGDGGSRWMEVEKPGLGRGRKKGGK